MRWLRDGSWWDEASFSGRAHKQKRVSGSATPFFLAHDINPLRKLIFSNHSRSIQTGTGKAPETEKESLHPASALTLRSANTRFSGTSVSKRRFSFLPVMVARNKKHNIIHHLKPKTRESSAMSFILFSNPSSETLSESYRELFFRRENYFLPVNDDIFLEKNDLPLSP